MLRVRLHWHWHVAKGETHHNCIINLIYKLFTYIYTFM